MIDEYEELGNSYEEYDLCRIEAISASSIADLNAWHEYQCGQQYIHNLKIQDLHSFAFPPSGQYNI
jgi:hypothetical protein